MTPNYGCVGMCVYVFAYLRGSDQHAIFPNAVITLVYIGFTGWVCTQYVHTHGRVVVSTFIYRHL